MAGLPHPIGSPCSMAAHGCGNSSISLRPVNCAVRISPILSLECGGFRDSGTPKIDPQIVGFPCNKDPKKVPRISETPMRPHVSAGCRDGAGLGAAV